MRQVEGGIEIETAAGRLAFLTLAALEARFRPLELADHPRPWMAAQTIAVEDLARLGETLRRRGHAPLAAGDRFLLPPAAANGCLLEFIADA